MRRFNACSAGHRSTFSTFVQLNQSYENHCFYVDHRPGDGRVLEFLRTEEGRADGRLQRVHDSFFDDEEELDHEEIIERFSRGLAGCEEEVDHEEGRSIAFA